MTAKKQDRIYSNVRQSFSHGRSRLVQVEIIPSAQPRSKKKRRRKAKKKALQAVAAAVSPAEQAGTGKRHQLKKKQRGNRKRSRGKPSFLSSALSRSRIIRSGKIKGLKKSSSGGVAKGGGAGFAGLSAGLPGNEDVDPPARRSTSTPADRWRDRLRS
jgi:hypothetical protein